MIEPTALQAVMTYEDYLKTDHWKAKRQEAIEFYGASCVLTLAAECVKRG